MNQIETVDLFPQLTEELLKLLRSLDNSDWLKPSPLENRSIKDLVSHLLDGSLRKLSIQRDRFEDETNVPTINSYNDLVHHIQTLNSDWIQISRRLSPKILIDLLAYSENQFNEYIKTLDPTEKAVFGVAWAGEIESENWFDIAREYTEKWHHQMQIRLALGKPILMDTKYTEPLYDTFMRGLPFLYSDFKDCVIGEKIKINLVGTLNKSWTLERQTEKWIFIENTTDQVNTSVELPDDVAWILFTNTDRNKEKYKSNIKTTGDSRFALRLLDYVTVMS